MKNCKKLNILEPESSLRRESKLSLLHRSKKKEPVLDSTKLLLKYNIFFSENGVAILSEMNVQLAENCTVAHCIHTCVARLQEKYPEINFPFKPTAYSLKFAKKNGLPKSDLPGMFFFVII